MTFDPRTYWEERLQANTGLQGVGFIGLGQRINQRMYNVRRRVFQRIVKRWLPHREGLRVLDVGSGTGFYIEQWGALGVAEITGSDFTATAVADLAQRFPASRFLQWDASDSPPFTGRFHAISCMDMLFHIVDDDRFQRALNNLHQLLEPGGLLFLSDNFTHRPAPRLEHFAGRDLRTYEEALAKAGFQRPWRRPMFVLLNFPADSRSPLLHRWWNHLERTAHRDLRKAERLAALAEPIEHVLVRLLREGPATEMAVCRAERPPP